MLTGLSVKNKINKNERKFTFEIFGYDFIIDQELHLWLIDINTNPCIEESSPLLAMYLNRMIDDALRLTLDVVFPARYEENNSNANNQNLNN